MDVRIEGTLSQFAEVELAPGEEIYADPGTLVCKDAGLQMDVRLAGGLGSGIARLLAGSGLHLVYFAGPGRVLLSKNRSGKIIELDLAAGEDLEVHPGALLLAHASVGLELVTLDFKSGVLGGAGLFWLRLRGPGRAYLQSWGDVRRMSLDDAQVVQVNHGRLVYKQRSVARVSGNTTLRGALFGGLGAFFVNLAGPGEICLQSRTRGAARGGSTRIDIKTPSREQG